MDLVKLETARQVFAVWFSQANGVSNFITDEDVRHKIVDACADAADRLCCKMGDTKGHPAETALAQLFDLMGDHPDKLAFKWVRANAKERGMKELCAYLGAERDGQ